MSEWSLWLLISKCRIMNRDASDGACILCMHTVQSKNADYRVWPVWLHQRRSTAFAPVGEQRGRRPPSSLE